MSIYSQEFENYIISGFRDETLNSLVPGSKQERFLYLVKKINNLEKVEDIKEVIISINH